jgi:hypothetical protein
MKRWLAADVPGSSGTQLLEAPECLRVGLLRVDFLLNWRE